MSASICPRRAAIATGNPGKVRGALRALSALCGIGREDLIIVDPPEGLPRQPIGGLQVFRGALLRAAHAYSSVAPRGFGVGVEAGPLEFYTGTGFIETQVAVIVGPGRRVSVGISAGFELPQSLLSRMLSGHELGALVQARKGAGDIGESIGYIGLATSGLVTREDLTFQAVAMAVVPWYTGETGSLAILEELMETTNI